MKSPIAALNARSRGENPRTAKWLFSKVTPKQEVWARSQHGAARTTHRVAFQIVAIEANPPDRQPLKQALTVWRCGGRASDWRGISIMPGPNDYGREFYAYCYSCKRPA